MIGIDFSRALQSSRRREMTSEEIDETLRRVISSRRAAEARAHERRRVPGFVRRWLIWQGFVR